MTDDCSEKNFTEITEEEVENLPEALQLTDLEALESIIGYRFTSQDLLLQSLTHTSFNKNYPDAGEHYERLEFLGDAFLSAILAELLYKTYPEEREGIPSLYRSALAQGSLLADLGRELGLEQFVRRHTGSSGVDSTVNEREMTSLLEDVVESLIGAIFLDSDFETTRRIVLVWYGQFKKRLRKMLSLHNRKGRLQELVQPLYGNEAITYEVVTEMGPDHNKSFTVAVRVAGESMGLGTGTSKKEAEENAAGAALELWEKEASEEEEE